MILNIDPVKSAVVSILGAAVGSLSETMASKFDHLLLFMQMRIPLPTDVLFQRTAWAVAIVAGLVSAYNGIANAVLRYRKNHPKSKQNE